MTEREFYADPKSTQAIREFYADPKSTQAIDQANSDYHSRTSRQRPRDRRPNQGPTGDPTATWPDHPSDEEIAAQLRADRRDDPLSTT